MFKATVYVTLKTGVFDPQGNVVKNSLHSLNYKEVEDVRIGKYMELTISSSEYSEAEKRVREMCERLLANTVIEEYRFDLVEG